MGKDTVNYKLYKQAQASLSTGIDLREAVKAPADVELNNWLNIHGKGW